MTDMSTTSLSSAQVIPTFTDMHHSDITPKLSDSVIRYNCQCCHLATPAYLLLHLADDPNRMAAVKELVHLNCNNTAVSSLEDVSTPVHRR